MRDFGLFAALSLAGNTFVTLFSCLFYWKSGKNTKKKPKIYYPDFGIPFLKKTMDVWTTLF
jgi:hypothetical protein